MARHKDKNWNLPEGRPDPNGRGKIHEHEDIQISVLMDIRDELKLLNALLGCHRFTGIPSTLIAIESNTRKKKRADQTRK